MQFRVCSENYCVWPVYHFEKSEVICFAQLEGKTNQFKLENDRKMLETVSYLITSVFSKLINIQRIAITKHRSNELLSFCKFLYWLTFCRQVGALGKKPHTAAEIRGESAAGFPGLRLLQCSLHGEKGPRFAQDQAKQRLCA